MQLLLWLEGTRVADFVRMTPYLYPVLESLHVIGIALLVGPAVAMDLRLLGVGRRAVPVTVAGRYLLPVSHVGFALVAATGAPMFVAVAVSVGSNVTAAVKFGLIGVAALNVAVFHFRTYRTVGGWDRDVAPPASAKAAAVVSASTWCAVVFAGRFLAY